MERRITDSKSRLKLRKLSQKIFDGAIQAHVAADEVDSAFFYAERSKSFNMLQAIRQQHLEQIRGVESGLLEQLRALENDIQKKRGNVIWGEDVQKNLADIEELEKERDLLEEELMSIPAYRKAYSTEVISVEAVKRELLGDQYAMIEYHVGDSVTFAFLLQEGTEHVFTIPIGRERIRALQQKMYQGIYERKSSSIQAKGIGIGSKDTLTKKKKGKLKAKYFEAGGVLYDSLFRPFENLLKPDQIIIIPDDALTLIPFGALLTDEPKDSLLDIPGQPYLIEQYTISYGHSASLLKEVKDMPEIKSTSLAMFAPSFGSSTGKSIITPEGDTLNNLPLGSTINSLVNKKDGVLFSDTFATKERFIAEICVDQDRSSSNLKSSHACLWTHGIISDQNPGDSYTCFAQRGPNFDKSQTLRNKELYQRRIPLDLLILFACQTNRGRCKSEKAQRAFAGG